MTFDPEHCPDAIRPQVTKTSNYKESVAIITATVEEAASLIIEEGTGMEALIEQHEFLMNAGRFHQVIVLNTRLQTLFSSYTYLFLERCVREGDVSTANSSLERYERTAVGVLNPIKKFWN